MSADAIIGNTKSRTSRAVRTVAMVGHVTGNAEARERRSWEYLRGLCAIANGTAPTFGDAAGGSAGVWQDPENADAMRRYAEEHGMPCDSHAERFAVACAIHADESAKRWQQVLDIVARPSAGTEENFSLIGPVTKEIRSPAARRKPTRQQVAALQELRFSQRIS